MKILHEVLPLISLIAAVSYFSGEELHDTEEWRHRQQRTNPAII